MTSQALGRMRPGNEENNAGENDNRNAGNAEETLLRIDEEEKEIYMEG